MSINNTIAGLSQRYDSFYLYDERKIREHTARLQKNFPGVEFLYSVKCNPNRQVLDCVFSQGFGADAASLGEVLLAQRAGLEKNRIYYSAPGKTMRDIENAMDKSVLIADSLDEIQRIQTAAQARDMIVKIGMRINPDFSFVKEGGVSSKFGIDEEQAIAFLKNNSCGNVKVTGIHVHIKSQELNGDALVSYYHKMCVLAERFQQLCGGLEYVNMGSGIGIDYTTEDQPLDMEVLGKAAIEAMREFRSRYPATRILIEVGRYAVCKSGYYVTKVIDRKVSYGKTFIILKNTLNGFIRPSLARLVMRYAGENAPAGCEPLFTAENAFAFRVLLQEPQTLPESSLVLKEEQSLETVTLVGNLCTAADVIAENIRMPHLEAGDCVVITNAGSYAAVLSPMQFASLDGPAEVFLAEDGRIICSNEEEV